MTFAKIPYGRQDITQADIDAVTTVLREDFLTQGPHIDAFEKAFASYIDCKYAVAVANGTAALHLAALALGVNKDSRVITSPITFAASANCVRYCGGEVHFVDIDPNTIHLDISKVKQLLESRPAGTFSGLIPVDLAGYPVQTELFRALADEHGLWILEDACHAPGGSFIDSQGVEQFCGNGKYADLAIFSFHPVKHIAAGEGGMITTNDKELYEKLIQLRTHGITKNPDKLLRNEGGWYYEMQTLGYNYRLTDFQCALGSSQLKRASQGLKRRREIAAKYDRAFADTEIRLIEVAPGFDHAYHLYVIQVDDRKGLYEHLISNKIYAQVHYIPVHLQPYYQELGWQRGDFPSAEKYYNHCLSIPMYPTLTEDEQDFVIQEILNFIQ